MFLNEAKKFYDEALKELFGEPAGASEEEIDSVERSLGHSLPAAYREFLRWMGNDVDGVFRGTDCFLKDLQENTEWLPEFFEELGVSSAATGNNICFWCHQGYVAVWFDAVQPNDDPECMGLSDTAPRIQPLGKFSDYIERCLRDLAI